VLVRPAGENLVLAPPYVVDRAQIEQMVGTLADAIKRQAQSA
jgi:beta-alanine--pyruvate transaminase